MSVSGIQGQLLEVTVVGCNKLKDTELFSRQDPYVHLEYASIKHRTRTHTDGGRHPTFQEKFVIPLIEGIREINVQVWNSNTVSYDNFIGEGKVHLQKVLSQGYDDAAWSLQSKSGRPAGEVRLIMHYTKLKESTKPNNPSPCSAPSASPCGAPRAHMYPPPYPPQPQMYAPPPPAAYYPSYPPAGYPPYGAPSAYPPAYPSTPADYYPSYPPAGYPPYGAPSAYPPAYPSTSTYPPPPSTYPSPPQGPSFYPPCQGSYGTYPPPPF